MNAEQTALELKARFDATSAPDEGTRWLDVAKVARRPPIIALPEDTLAVRTELARLYGLEGYDVHGVEYPAWPLTLVRRPGS